MKKKERVQFIIETLENLYPETPIPLLHNSDYELLIAVLLSAQCTDARVNTITPILFAKAKTPSEMILISIEEIENIIRPCGLSPSKSKAIWNLSRILLDKHHGEVPQTFEELEELPGVGHKTASVVMSQAFGIPAFPVDTHIQMETDQRQERGTDRARLQTVVSRISLEQIALTNHFLWT
jgi:endonuclease-3